MREVQKHALLSKTEEHELAAGYVKTGDRDAAARLVTANLRLVVKIAYEYRRAYRNMMDLIQEGNIGLMQAVKRYDRRDRCAAFYSALHVPARCDALSDAHHAHLLSVHLSPDDHGATDAALLDQHGCRRHHHPRGLHLARWGCTPSVPRGSPTRPICPSCSSSPVTRCMWRSPPGVWSSFRCSSPWLPRRSNACPPLKASECAPTAGFVGSRQRSTSTDNPLSRLASTGRGNRPAAFRRPVGAATFRSSANRPFCAA
jgi:hypothetical protein